MHSRYVRFSTFLPLAILAVAVADLLFAARQQPPPAPTVVRPVVPQNQEIQPPEPGKGEGVDFSIQMINGATGKPLSGVRIELNRNPIINSPQSAADRRRWK